MAKKLLSLCIALVLALYTPLAYAANPYVPANAVTAKIYDLQLDTATGRATVSWHGDHVANIVVALYTYTYDAGGQSSTYTEYDRAEHALADPQPTQENAQTMVTFSALPDLAAGFRMIAWLEDASGVRVSEEFVDDTWTKETQALYAMTMSDPEFAGLQVIDASANFGAGSFLALKDTVTLVHAKEGGISVVQPVEGSAAENEYELSNLSAAQLESYAGLKKGDLVCVVHGEQVENFYGLTVDSVRTQDGKVFLTAAPEQLKLDEYTEAARLKELRLEWNHHIFHDNVAFSVDTDFYLTLIFDIACKGTSISFKAQGKMDALNTKLAVDTPSVGFEAPLVKIPLAGIPVLADVEFNINLEGFVSAAGAILFDIRDAAIGFRITASLWHGISINELCNMPKIVFLGTEVDAEAFVGLGIGVSGNLLSMLSVALKVYVGPVAHLTWTGVSYWDKDKRWHACDPYTCWSLSLKISFSLQSTVTAFKHFTKSAVIAQVSTPDLANYWKSSTFGDEGNEAQCPHQGYRLYVDVVDSDGNPIPNATVSNTWNPQHYEKHSRALTNEKGEATLYIPMGKTKLDAQITLNKDGKELLFYVLQDFEEKGYREDTTTLYDPSVTLTLDTRAYKVEFKDPAQSGDHGNWPENVTYYRAQYQEGQEPRLPEAIPTRSGNVFVGWSTDPAAKPEDALYAPGQTIDFNNDPTFNGKDATLYAVWKLAGDETYHVIYSAPNHVANMPPDESYLVINADVDTVKVSNLAPQRTDGWVFSHWEGEPTVHNPDGHYDRNDLIWEKFTDKGDVRKTLHLNAVWMLDPAIIYQVHYDLNGAPGQTPASQTVKAGDVVIIRDCPKWDDQHIFQGWAIQGGAMTPTCFPRMGYTFSKDTTLVALWDRQYRITSGEGSEWVRGQSGPLRFVGNGADQYFFAVRVDGQLLETQHYTRTRGSSVAIDLHEDYLAGLANGSHTIQLLYHDGETQVVRFTISDPPPMTGDETPVLLLTGLIALTGAAMLILARRKRA